MTGSALSKKGHKPWDVCKCSHAWISHSNDDGPCTECNCIHFSWAAVPDAIDDLKSILKDLKD